MKRDYTKLDAAILEGIAACDGRPIGFYRLGNLASIRGEAEWLAAEPNATKSLHLHTQRWLIFERRIQALRKAGRIKHSRKPEGWSLVKEGFN